MYIFQARLSVIQAYMGVMARRPQSFGNIMRSSCAVFTHTMAFNTDIITRVKAL